MATTCLSLPTEIWINVFNRMDTWEELAQCRLICRKLDPIAEKVLFSQPYFCFKRGSRKFADSLQRHITRKPNLAKLIKRLEITPPVITDDAVFGLPCQLLKALITPSIEEISGTEMPLGFYNMLCKLIQTESSPHAFSKLKSIPAPEGQFKAYLDLLYLLKDTLTSIAFNNFKKTPALEVLLDRLHEFKQLHTIDLRLQRVSGFDDLDSILNKFPSSVKDLTISVNFHRNFNMWPCNKANRWQIQGLSKDKNLKKLCLAFEEGCDLETKLVDYMLYKYAQLESFSYKGLLVEEQSAVLLATPKGVPMISLKECVCVDEEDIAYAGKHLKSKSNRVEMYHSTLIGRYQGCQIDVVKDSTACSSTFDIILQERQEQAYFMNFLSSFGKNGAAKITHLKIDLRHAAMYGDDSTFYDMIKLVPHVQELYFGDLEIEFQHLDATELVLNDLKTLTIFGAKISNRVIQQLEQIAPNLEELRLCSSAVVDGNDKDGDTGNHTQSDVAISMPGVAFKNISIVTDEYSFKKMGIWNSVNWSHIAEIESMLDGESNLYIHIKTQEAAEQFYLLPHRKRSIVVISKKEFDLYSPGSLVIDIECKALSQLSVDLQRHKVCLRWNNGVLVVPDYLDCLELKDLDDFKRP